MDLVSIIVPVYNVEKYLDENIYSLLNQTYRNIEIILIDDGSKDNSGYLCDQATQIDKRVKVIHKENAGLGYARNSGLELAKGKYVTFIDSDDVADINLVEMLVDGIKKNDADTCIGGFKRIDELGRILYKESYKFNIYSGEDIYNKLFVRMLGSAPDKHDAIKMSVWNVMYSMDIVKNNCLKFHSEREFISEDIIWDCDYYKYSKKTVIIDSIAYGYRVTPGSLTQKYKKDKFHMICDLYLELEKRILNTIPNKDVITRLQRQFFVNLRSCLKQESYANKNYIAIYKAIKYICTNDIVRRILSEYPINKINFNARVFLYMLKWNLHSVLTLLVINEMI